MSFLEMLDVLNEQLITEGEEPVAFDHDCREGICGACGMMINGQPHGPLRGTTTCQLHMRHFSDGDVIVIEPFRAKAFPIIRDLAVNRSSFDRIIAAGGYVSVNTGQAADGNTLPIPQIRRRAPSTRPSASAARVRGRLQNASALLFTSAKVSHLAQLPQGDGERKQRVLSMVAQHDEEGFGWCTNTYECEAACPAEISVRHIARLNREHVRATVAPHERT